MSQGQHLMGHLLIVGCHNVLLWFIVIALCRASVTLASYCTSLRWFMFILGKEWLREGCFD
ncbi:hypothetical protein DPMN_061308 [Dreissena polymorpha]|uniref:Uncharacterized protein n=1 Tax=Dreissena polymorpha TaxID=45954 RepID=A0A9D4HIC1_DREPO|nr:hypothetical protein DPMN_061308 [Dreissena polymorpha]